LLTRSKFAWAFTNNGIVVVTVVSGTVSANEAQRCPTRRRARSTSAADQYNGSVGATGDDLTIWLNASDYVAECAGIRLQETLSARRRMPAAVPIAFQDG
jgi:hypothetical protein